MINLEEHLLKRIENYLEKKDLSVMSLISYAKEKQYFSPELFEILFIECLQCASDLSQKRFVAVSFEKFSLNVSTAGKLINNYIQTYDPYTVRLPTLLTNLIEMPQEAGVFFPIELFLDNSIIMKAAGVLHLESEKQLINILHKKNNENHALYLNNTLSYKTTSTRSPKI